MWEVEERGLECLKVLSMIKTLAPISESTLSLSLKVLSYLDSRKGLGSAMSEIMVWKQSMIKHLLIKDFPQFAF